MRQISVKLPKPTSKQKQFLTDTHRYVGYGGARGGGKSWAIRIKSVVLCLAYPGITCCIVRRTYQELMDNHMAPFLKLLPPAVYKFNLSRKELTFINGSMIRFRFCSCDSDVRHFQGNEADVLFIDEGTQFTEDQFKMMTASVRGVNNFPKRIYVTCNPGGVGHEWVKRLFVDREYKENEDPSEYSFIQANVYDNDELLKADPDYIKRLEMQNPGVREAWLEGKWDLDAGRFFPEFKHSAHVCEPFVIPQSWRRYRAIDYGLDMLACLWFAVSPEGDVYVYRELHEPNREIWKAAARINEMTDIEHGESVYLTLAPTDIWSRSQETGRARADLFRESGLDLTKSSNDRIAGWSCLRELLRVWDSGETKLHIFRTCTNLIKNLPQLQFDPKKVNDCLTEPHDITHVCDALRYFSVWWFRPNSVGDEDSGALRRWTDDMWEDYDMASPSEREYLIKKWGKPAPRR